MVEFEEYIDEIIEALEEEQTYNILDHETQEVEPEYFNLDGLKRTIHDILLKFHEHMSERP